MSQNILELQDLAKEMLTRELIEKTNACGIEWDQVSSTSFHGEQTAESTTFDYYITKTQIGSLTYKYTLDVKKDGATYVTSQDGPLPYTARDSATKDLYELVELQTLDLDAKVKEAIRFLQKRPDCRNDENTSSIS